MTTITIIVANNHRFEVERELLIDNSDYFRRLLDGTFNDVQDNSITYTDITRSAFQDFIVWLYNHNYQPIDVKRTVELYELQLRFAATSCTLAQFVRKLSDVRLSDLVLYIAKLALEFDEELINSLACHYRIGDDLSALSEEFVTAIHNSKYCPYYGDGLLCDIVCKLETLAKIHTAPKKQYIFVDSVCVCVMIP